MRVRAVGLVPLAVTGRSAPVRRASAPCGATQGVLNLESFNSFNSTDQSPQWAPGPQSTPPDDGRGPLGHEKRIYVRCFHLFENVRF